MKYKIIDVRFSFIPKSVVGVFIELEGLRVNNEQGCLFMVYNIPYKKKQKPSIKSKSVVLLPISNIYFISKTYKEDYYSIKEELTDDLFDSIGDNFLTQGEINIWKGYIDRIQNTSFPVYEYCNKIYSNRFKV